MVPPSLPSWPSSPPAHGRVVLREVRPEDVAMARELSTDPYVPMTGTLPANATMEEAVSWVRRQRSRHAEGAGFSFTITDAATGAPVGHCGLWLRQLAEGRASAGYSIVPSARGRGLASDALRALTAFGWTVPGLTRIVLYIEPWNVASIRTAQRAGYASDGLLPDHEVGDGVRREVLRYVATRAGQ